MALVSAFWATAVNKASCFLGPENLQFFAKSARIQSGANTYFTALNIFNIDHAISAFILFSKYPLWNPVAKSLTGKTLPREKLTVPNLIIGLVPWLLGYR